MKRSPRIVVVGAGIAGIGAAVRLQELGFTDVTILEAKGKVGGRIAKYQLGKAWIDMGAEYIHGVTEENPVYCLAKKYGLLDDIPKEEGKWSLFTDKGSIVNVDFAERVYKVGQQIIKQKFQNDSKKSIGEHFTEEAQKLTWDGTEDEKRLVPSILSMVGKDLLIDTGASDLNNLSLASWYYFPDSMAKHLNIGGYMFNLPTKMLEGFPAENVLLRKPVTKIEWDGTFGSGTALEYPVRVEFGDGEEMLADHVLVTISLGCLRAQASSLFSPELPEYKLQAIESVQYGTIAKIFLEYEEAFWDSDVSEISLLWEEESPNSASPDPADWTRHLHFFTVMRPKELFGNVLVGWCTGKVAEKIEVMKEEDLSAAITEHLRAFTRNPSLPPPKTMVRTQWHSNHFTRGTYSFIPVGTDAEIMDKLAQPLSSTKDTGPGLQLLFAGEGTMKDLYSTIQGALLSGQREADRLALHHQKTISSASFCPLSAVAVT